MSMVLSGLTSRVSYVYFAFLAKFHAVGNCVVREYGLRGERVSVKQFKVNFNKVCVKVVLWPTFDATFQWHRTMQNLF